MIRRNHLLGSPVDICRHYAGQHLAAVCNGDMQLLHQALQLFQISTTITVNVLQCQT